MTKAIRIAEIAKKKAEALLKAAKTEPDQVGRIALMNQASCLMAIETVFLAVAKEERE